MENLKNIEILPIQTTQLEVLPHYKEKMLLSTGKGTLIVDKNAIGYLRSQSNYCEVHYGNNKNILCSKTLKSIADRLNSHNFIRVHNSFVVNLNYISKISSSFTSLYLEDGTQIPISRVNKANLKLKILHFFD